MVASRGSTRSAVKAQRAASLSFRPTWSLVNSVPTGGQFDFNLSPGHYVIELPHYGGGNGWDLGSRAARGLWSWSRAAV